MELSTPGPRSGSQCTGLYLVSWISHIPSRPLTEIEVGEDRIAILRRAAAGDDRAVEGAVDAGVQPMIPGEQNELKLPQFGPC